MALATLNDLLLDGMRDMYNAERQVVKALPRMARAASSPELRQAFEHHLEETRHHVARLDQAFARLGVPIRGRHCRGMDGLLEEGREFHEGGGADLVLDAGIISEARKVEHYEMAAYGCLITWAETLGEIEVAHLVEQSLHEEKAADEKLSQLAEDGVNRMAMQPDGQAPGE